MKEFLNVGIVGAGNISDRHVEFYTKNQYSKVVAISDLNEDLARNKAKEYGIEHYTTNYKELLADENIDAVSIATPTFTHCEIVIAALNAGKHVLCEKPPALNAKEVEKCCDVAKKTGKLLMYGLVCRFKQEASFLKEYIDKGKMGKVYHAEASRVSRCMVPSGWFRDKNKAGGGLLDGCIHEIDACLYLMGYPKPVSALGFTSNVNRDLPDRVKGVDTGYLSADSKSFDISVESVACGFVTFENGACLHIKSAYIMNSVNVGTSVDICGEKAGARYSHSNPQLQMVNLTDDDYFMESNPILNKEDIFFEKEINHFVDCCINGTKCIVTPEQAVTLMKIIDAIYQSAETGSPILID